MIIGIEPEDILHYAVRPAITVLQLSGRAVEELLVGTAIHESGDGRSLDQVRGPALSPWQMEPATHDDIWANFLAFRADLMARTKSLAAPGVGLLTQLPGNLIYAAGMARLRYYRVKDALPGVGDIQAQASYWKAHYNTPSGAGTVQEYIDHWNASGAASLWS